jgi:Snf7
VLTVARASIGHRIQPCAFTENVHLCSCPAADKKVAEAKTMDALSSLRQKEQINTEKIAHLQKQIDAQGAMVKKFLTAQDKDKAKMALKRKKMLEKQVEAVQNVRSRCCCCCSRFAFR